MDPKGSLALPQVPQGQKRAPECIPTRDQSVRKKVKLEYNNFDENTANHGTEPDAPTDKASDPADSLPISTMPATNDGGQTSSSKTRTNYSTGMGPPRKIIRQDGALFYRVCTDGAPAAPAQVDSIPASDTLSRSTEYYKKTTANPVLNPEAYFAEPAKLFFPYTSTELPPEIRTRIQQFALSEDKPINLSMEGLKWPSLASVNKEHSETVRLLYLNRNIFRININDHDTDRLDEFIRYLDRLFLICGSNIKRAVRHVKRFDLYVSGPTLIKSTIVSANCGDVVSVKPSFEHFERMLKTALFITRCGLIREQTRFPAFLPEHVGNLKCHLDSHGATRYVVLESMLFPILERLHWMYHQAPKGGPRGLVASFTGECDAEVLCEFSQKDIQEWIASAAKIAPDHSKWYVDLFVEELDERLAQFEKDILALEDKCTRLRRQKEQKLLEAKAKLHIKFQDVLESEDLKMIMGRIAELEEGDKVKTMEDEYAGQDHDLGIWFQS